MLLNIRLFNPEASRTNMSEETLTTEVSLQAPSLPQGVASAR
jgi:hypothetical protein